MTSASSSEQLHRFIFDNSDVRGEVVSLEHSFQQAAQAQNIPPVLLPLYGEFLAAAALLAELLKFDGALTLQARGDGAVPVVMAEVNSKGQLRGYIQVNEDQTLIHSDTDTLLPLSELFGKAVLTMTVDPSQGKRYQGIVPLDGASLAQCLEHYFAQSEQLPTFIKLFANDKKSGGLMLQCLPAQVVTDTEKRDEQWQTIVHLAATTQAQEQLDLDHPSLLYRLFHEVDCRIFEPKTLAFKCQCSKERSANAIKTLGEAEIQAMIDEQQQAEIQCHFCGQTYHFDQASLNKLKAQVAKH